MAAAAQRSKSLKRPAHVRLFVAVAQALQPLRVRVTTNVAFGFCAHLAVAYLKVVLITKITTYMIHIDIKRTFT